MTKANDPGVKIAAYMKKLTPEKRAALEHVRDLIVAAAPDATPALVYGVPGFKLNGQALVCYAAFKAHCGFYPMSAELMDEMAAELGDSRVAEGTIHFTPETPLSDELVIRLVKARVEMLSG